MQPFDLQEPTSLAEALGLLAEHGDGAKLIAGGMALVVLMKQKMYQPECLVSTRKIAELQGIGPVLGAGLRIGGAMRHHDAETHPAVQQQYPLLAAAIHKVGNIRVRQMGTLAGNVSHFDYMADPPTALVALGATVVLVGPAGRRELPMADFLLGPYQTQLAPGEILVEVRVPPARPGAISRYVKFAIPTETERPLVNLGLLAWPQPDRPAVAQDITLVVGSVAGRPLRLTAVEDQLRGQPLTPALAAQAAAAAIAGIEPVEDGRAPVWYKREVTQVIIRRALEDIAHQLSA